MRHYYINNDQSESAAHYACTLNCFGSEILVQVSDDTGQQVRIKLTRSQALHFADLIIENANIIKD